jgi:hypothetical protein
MRAKKESQTMPRAYTDKLLELLEEGCLSWEAIARECLCYMSEDDVEDMCRTGDMLVLDESEEEEEEED